MFGLQKGWSLLCTAPWMSLGDIRLRELGQSPTKGKIFYVAPYMKFLPYANSQRHKVKCRLPGAGGREKEEELLFRRCRVFVGNVEKVLGVQ